MAAKKEEIGQDREWGGESGSIRCNMDIKFIGSGASAKGILYYITDYITKSQLKTHVAFSMLELAVKKLGEFNPFEDELTELSGQQVASYLMDFEDHFTSHLYRNFYWTAFETFINQQIPSPECYPSKQSASTPESVEQPKENQDSTLDNDETLSENSDDEGENEGDETPYLNTLLEPDSEIDANLSNENEEIRVSVDGTGNLVPLANQLADYQKRGKELDNSVRPQTGESTGDRKTQTMQANLLNIQTLLTQPKPY
ncbi:hypothetical protein B0H14DRAFT_2618490 [Mycena olivaceomarginata]|nr:hypothetical protein B0H14DRAFT_2618490 [Mycena olivaceomarginata]